VGTVKRKGLGPRVHQSCACCVGRYGILALMGMGFRVRYIFEILIFKIVIKHFFFIWPKSALLWVFIIGYHLSSSHQRPPASVFFFKLKLPRIFRLEFDGAC
jgi:hypothetical protein